jgi:hypothetical protein
MAAEPKPPRNSDQELPPRKGDAIESPEPARDGDRETHKPLPEKETYERESPNRDRTEESH